MPTEVERIRRLNEMLRFLSIPIILQSSLDLTPSLLVAMLESLLRERLPLSTEARQSRTRAGRTEAMKWFLGILGDDVLGQDLGMIDPRMLAEGGQAQVRGAADALLLAWDQSHFINARAANASAPAEEAASSPRVHAQQTTTDDGDSSTLEEGLGEDDGQGTSLGTDHSRTLGQTTVDSRLPTYEDAEHSRGRRIEIRYEGWMSEVEEEEGAMAERTNSTAFEFDDDEDDMEAEDELLAELDAVNADVVRLLGLRASLLEALSS